MSELAFRSAVELARMVREREIGAVDLLEHYLARVERFDGALNAIVHTDVVGARARARAADEALARGENWGPLHGLPVTVKESFDWIGSPSTWGAPELRENHPSEDSAVVERLVAAGAVLFGKTNVPLMLFDWQSYNDIYGTTNNPWDLGRTPGGSSGGAAAALAAGLTALECGSDIGASIRNPAHYCGVFGHKPTYGIVPMRGCNLPGVVSAADISVAGPLARGAADLDLTLGVLAGADRPDDTAWRLELPAPPKKALADFKVGVMLTDPNCAQDGELTDRLQHTVDALAKAGVQIDDEARPDLDTTRAHRVYLLLRRAVTTARLPVEGFEAHRAAAAAREETDVSYQAWVERGATLYHRDWLKLHEERSRMRLKWAEFFETHDLLLCPTAASAAFPHDHEGERVDRTIPVNDGQEPTVDQLFWAGLASVVHLPATVAPAGLTRSGLPVGLQMIGPHLGDRTCIAFAGLMEQELGGFVPPPGYH